MNQHTTEKIELPKTIEFMLSGNSIDIAIDNITFRVNKWFKTKDLHPKYNVLQKIYNILNRNNQHNGGLHKVIVIHIIMNDKLKELHKLKNNRTLYNILIHNYLDSNEGFEYVITAVEKELNHSDYIKRNFQNELLL